MARTQNPEVLIGRTRQARAEAVRLQSRQGILPTLTVDATYLNAELGVLDTPSSGVRPAEPLLPWGNLNPVEGNVLGVQLLQPLVNVGAWHAGTQAARRLDAARLSLERIADEAAVSTIEAYFAAVTASALVDAETRGLEAARRSLAQAEGAYAEGLAPRLDVLNARTRVSEMEARLGNAEAGVVAARSGLHEVLGIDGEVTLTLTDHVPEPSRRLGPDRGALLERADLQALQQGVAAAEAGVKRARAGYLPDLSLFARYQRIELNEPMNYDEKDWIVGVNFGWTLFSGFGVQGAVDEAEADARERRAELRARRRSAQSEARDTHAWWQAELRAWESATSSVAGAEEALELAERRYAEGLNDMTELLLAQANALGARTRALHARYRAVIAAQRYLLAIGAHDAGRLWP